jgi:hypothetical protein
MPLLRTCGKAIVVADWRRGAAQIMMPTASCAQPPNPPPRRR